MNITMRHSRKHQSGAILVVSLLLLLVLTILGVVMMQTTRMQERMSGNTRDISTSLQGSEAALRFAENELAAFTDYNLDGTSTCGATSTANTICGIAVLPVDMADPTQFDWKNTNLSKQYGATNSTAVAQVYEQPRYTDEYLGQSRVGESLDGGHDVPSYPQFFQLTGQSTGASGQASTVIQSTFTRRF